MGFPSIYSPSLTSILLGTDFGLCVTRSDCRFLLHSETGNIQVASKVRRHTLDYILICVTFPADCELPWLRSHLLSLLTMKQAAICPTRVSAMRADPWLMVALQPYLLA